MSKVHLVGIICILFAVVGCTNAIPVEVRAEQKVEERFNPSVYLEQEFYADCLEYEMPECF